MPLAKRTLGGLAAGREGGHEDVVKRLAVGNLFLEGRGSCAQLIVGEFFQLLLKRVDRIDLWPVAADAPFVGGAKQFTGYGADHRSIPSLHRSRHARLATTRTRFKTLRKYYAF